MEINLKVKNNIAVLIIKGKVDINAAQLVETVGQCLREGYSDIICDFEEVDFIDYMGISAIALAYKEVMNKNGRMKFAALSSHLQNMFLVVGLDKVIEFYATPELAINSFKEDRIIESIKRMQLRRRFKRIPVDIKLELKPVGEKQAASHKADMLNLSGVGAYIYGCAKFKLGDDVTLRFNFGPQNEEFILEAKVIWLSDKQIQPQAHPGMGLIFHNICSATQDKIVRYVERNLAHTV